MQLLHPLATFVAKSTLLALPAYPAAWPQAKKHPFIQAIARGYRDFESLNVVQKTGYRYRQTECATQKIVDVIGRVASIVGLRYLWNTLLGWLNGTVAWIGKASRDAMRNNVEELSRVWLIGSIVRNYAARYSGDKPSEREPEFSNDGPLGFRLCTMKQRKERKKQKVTRRRKDDRSWHTTSSFT